MNARQDKYASYVDRKKLDDILHVDDKGYVYFPRIKWVRLELNSYEPFRVIFADDPIYCIEIKTQNRTFMKVVVTRDRIKRRKVMLSLAILMKTFLWKRKAYKIM